VGRRPGFTVAQHGIEDGQQLAHGGDEGQMGGFAGFAQTAIEALECGIVLDADEASHVERRPDLDATALDFTLAAISAAVVVDWGDANQGGDLVAIDLAESGSSAIRVRATTLPMPGTLLSRSCLAHQTGLASINLSIALSMRVRSASRLLSTALNELCATRSWALARRCFSPPRRHL
jgi:hypothetical protein